MPATPYMAGTGGGWIVKGLGRIGTVQTQAKKPHEAQPIADLELGLFVGRPVQRLHDQHLEHQHRVHRRTDTLRTIRPLQRNVKIIPEYLEIHHRRKPLQQITVLRQRRVPLIKINNPG